MDNFLVIAWVCITVFFIFFVVLVFCAVVVGRIKEDQQRKMADEIERCKDAKKDKR